MKAISIAELMVEAERELQSAFGESFKVSSRRTFAGEYYRGGFEILFSSMAGNIEVCYSDMQLEVKYNDKELFGVAMHEGFAGNMFSREHLREYLPRIAASISSALQRE